MAEWLFIQDNLKITEENFWLYQFMSSSENSISIISKSGGGFWKYFSKITGGLQSGYLRLTFFQRLYLKFNKKNRVQMYDRMFFQSLKRGDIKRFEKILTSSSEILEKSEPNSLIFLCCDLMKVITESDYEILQRAREIWVFTEKQKTVICSLLNCKSVKVSVLNSGSKQKKNYQDGLIICRSPLHPFYGTGLIIDYLNSNFRENLNNKLVIYTPENYGAGKRFFLSDLEKMSLSNCCEIRSYEDYLQDSHKTSMEVVFCDLSPAEYFNPKAVACYS